MPQLDTYMYLSQVFWLLVLFTTFYILILNNILPNISRILKLRRTRLSSQRAIAQLAQRCTRDPKIKKVVGSRLAGGLGGLPSIVVLSSVENP